MAWSQNNEERVILDFFGDFKGRYLDIGSFDGMQLSNCYQLALNGWYGSAIECSPPVFTRLMKNYKDLKNINLIFGAVTVKHGEVVKFWDSLGDAVSSTEADHVKQWSNYIKEWQEIYVPTISLNQLFSITGYDIDFISIDTEGTSVDLAIHLPYDKLTKLRCICVEHNDRQAELIEVLKPFGFSQRSINGENIILTK